MARIRSIKPDFFTSESIASLPISARLTFIGLWTHVDDNGVTVDNAKLIAAAIWPLEDDPRETLQRLREDLRRLHEALLITRYEVDGKRYLFVANWDEHQKVSHPKKSRYPRPGGEGCTILTCENTDPREVLAKPSGELPEDRPKPLETLRPEQGAGSREQGVPPSAGAPKARRASRPADNEETDGTTTQTLLAEWLEKCRKRPPGQVIGQVSKSVKTMLAEGVDLDDIRRGLDAWRAKGQHPSTLPSFVNEAANASPRTPPGASSNGWAPYRNPDSADAYAGYRPHNDELDGDDHA